MSEKTASLSNNLPSDPEKLAPSSGSTLAQSEPSPTSETGEQTQLQRDRDAIVLMFARMCVFVNGGLVILTHVGIDGLMSSAHFFDRSKLVELPDRPFYVQASAVISSLVMLICMIYLCFFLPRKPNLASASAPTLLLRELGEIWRGGWAGWKRPRIEDGKLNVPFRWHIIFLALGVGSSAWTLAAGVVREAKS